MATITRNDVAKVAGVAPSTVSNVLNSKGNVSEVRRKRVLKAIQQLDYHPNVVARSLMKKTSNQFALFMDDITNPHFATMAKGAAEEAAKQGYVLSVNFTAQNVNDIVEDYISRHVDGIIFNSYSGKLSEHVIEKLCDSNIACIRCGDINKLDFPFIGLDYYGGMMQVYGYLSEKGHQKIAYISGQGKEQYNRELRAQAFYSCCQQSDRGFDESYIEYGKPPYLTDRQSGFENCKRLFERNNDFTAIIVANDYMALGVIEYLKSVHIRVPDDISIVSFDNSIFSLCSSPNLTSAGSDVAELGRRAVQKLIHLKQGFHEPHEEWVEMNIYEKGSVKAI